MPVENRGLPIFKSAAFPGLRFELVGLSGREALSELFEFTIDLAPREEFFLGPEEFDGFCREPAWLEFHDGALFRVHGMVRRVELLPSTSREESIYRLTLVPRLWRATQVVRSRVYQEMSVPEIVESVLKEIGLGRGKDFQFELQTDHSPPDLKREYVVQYAESSFQFISRLMEHEGMFFLFRHEDDREQLVIADNNHVFDTLPGSEIISYSWEGVSTELREEVTSIQWTANLLPNQLVVRDYNWRSPTLFVHGHARVDPEGAGYVVHYGEHVREERRARQLATIRAQEVAATKHVYRGTLRVPGLRAGHRFKLDGHFLGEALDREYIVTSLDHGAGHSAGFDGQGALSRFEVIPAKVPYRPPRRTPRPVVQGLLTGIVDGSGTGTPAPVDGQGRYQVMLPFDTAAKQGGAASRWIRMAQVSTGSGYGIHFPLHIGTEVILDHVNGDPDRPLIVGAVPNAITQSPVLSDNATQSVIRTRGNIVFEFEDDA